MALALFLAPSAYPLGGVADWLEYLLPGLEARGWRCVLGLTEGHHHDPDAYLRRHPWGEVVRVANPTGSAHGRILALRHAIDAVRPDLVAVVNVSCAYEAIRQLRLRGGPVPKVVMTLHGLQSDLLGDVARERDALDAVIATNALAVALAREHSAHPERVRYAAYGVPQQPHHRHEQVPRRAGVQLLYCGRLEQSQKRILDLVPLAAQLEQRGLPFVIRIAGAGPDEAILKQEIGMGAAANSFQFLGSLTSEELAREYRRHDALVITSVWETGPIVAWEAMSQGLPVISSRYVGSGLEAALVDGENCLLFEVGDMGAAAQAAQRLTDSALREKIVQNALELVRTRYSRQVSVQQWHAAFEWVLGLPPLDAPSATSRVRQEGRLDNLLGIQLGEYVRRMAGINFRHTEPGGEWPHTGQASTDHQAFLAAARAYDQGGANCPKE